MYGPVTSLAVRDSQFTDLMVVGSASGELVSFNPTVAISKAAQSQQMAR